MSLMELLAVVTLMGVLASSVAMRYGREILGDTGVRSKASELSIGLNHAQRAAIRSGIPHGITFAGSLSQVQSWSVVRFDHDGTQTVVPFGKHQLRAEQQARDRAINNKCKMKKCAVTG